MANNTFAVDRISKRFAHFLVLENGVGEVNADVLKRRALMGFDVGAGIVLEPGEHVRF